MGLAIQRPGTLQKLSAAYKPGITAKTQSSESLKSSADTQGWIPPLSLYRGDCSKRLLIRHTLDSVQSHNIKS